MSGSFSRYFCPGHITGFFEIRKDTPTILEQGSRGSGLNLSHGVVCAVELVEECSHQILHGQNSSYREKIISNVFLLLSVNGVPLPSNSLPITRRLVKMFFSVILEGATIQSPAAPHTLKMDVIFSLPVSQGFGMSGAGLLSQIFALNDVLGSPLSSEHCAQLAHICEVQSGTGLGDVPAQVKGGFTVRKKPGISPYGEVLSFKLNCPVLLAVLGLPLETSTILGDPVRRKEINIAGRGLVESLLEAPTLGLLGKLSHDFSLRSGLVADEVAVLCSMVGETGLGRASMCMLGNSLFVVFPPGTHVTCPAYQTIYKILQESVKGEGCVVIESFIDPDGVRPV